MPHLVHIAPEAEARKIRRNGIAARRLQGFIPDEDRFVWAFPILPSYTLTYSWMRDLKPWGRSSLVAIVVLAEGGKTLYACHYRERPVAMTAAEACGMIRNREDPRGFEIIIPRRIAPAEIVRIAGLPKGIGWRYAPEFKNSARFPCDCPSCLPRGEVKARRYRERIPVLQRRYEAARSDG